jgi:four helix bundle protein
LTPLRLLNLRTSHFDYAKSLGNLGGIGRAPSVGMTPSNLEELRAWQLTYSFKLAVYDLLRTSDIATDSDLCGQLRRAARSAASQLQEGHARFYPKDFGRMAVSAKASLAECRGHLQDAKDSGLISEETLETHDNQAQEALKELAGLIDYLQSPEAEQNAKRIRAQRTERWRERHQRKSREHSPPAPKLNEQGTPNSEPRTPNDELRTPNDERGTEN